MIHVHQDQHGSAATVLIVGVLLVVALTVGAGAYFLLANKQESVAGPDVTAPVSPYDPLVDGDSNRSLRSNVFNVESGLKQEQLHLEGSERAVNDTPNIIADD